MGLAFLLGLCVPTIFAAPNSGNISGVVTDPAGTPQMGASVVVLAEQLQGILPIEVLTNDRGRFSTISLPTGTYTVKVTLAGFLPAMEQHIQVADQRTTLLEIALGSLLSSFDKLRRQPDQQPVASDEWIWVLRSASATRPILRWQEGDTDLEGDPVTGDFAEAKSFRGRMDLTSGADHPGSVSNLANSPATAFAYDLGLGSHGRLLMAGQFSYEGGAPAGGMAVEWLPSGELSAGSVNTIVIRESRLGPGGPTFRGLRASHENQLAINDRVSVRYGGEFLAAGLNGTAFTMRPRGEIAVQLSPTWQTSVTVAASPWQDAAQNPNALQSALNSLDSFPTLLMRSGRSVLDNNLHEEVALEHALGQNSTITAAFFHDRSNHTAVFGRGAVSGPDFLQDYFSDVFAYDAGASSSLGTRVAYRQKFSDNFETTFIYAYAGALAPNEDPAEVALRDQLTNRYRHSFAVRASMQVPRVKTRVTTGYKWISGSAANQQDPFGEALYRVDPYLSLELRQPLPTVFSCHMEALADFGNLLAQGYVPIATGDGRVVLVPSYRYFRGGLTLQF
jgi:carboxypeptidase family protein